MRYASAQRRADQDYADQNGSDDVEAGGQGEHHWVQRDESRNLPSPASGYGTLGIILRIET
jgi:hypothetical protein